MNITKVTQSNLFDFYDRLAELTHTDIPVSEHGKQFTTNLYKVMSNISLTFEIEEITEYEYTVMKSFVSYASKFKRNEKSFEDLVFINSNYNDIRLILSERINLIGEIEKFIKERTNTDVNCSRLLLPSGCITGSCNVRLSGVQLMSFMNCNPFNFFNDMTESDCVDWNNDNESFKEGYLLDGLNLEKFNNNIIKSFIKKFYTYLSERLISTGDVLSDCMMFNFYNKYNKNVTFYSLIGENGERSSNDKEYDILKYNVNSVTAPDNNPMDVKIQMVLNTSFSIYFDLLNILPFDRFTNTENYINILNRQKIESESCPQHKLLDSFKARIKASETKLKNEIDNCYNNTSSFIKLGEMTMNYYTYRYSITLSLDDVNRYLGQGKIDNSDICSIELHKVIKEIIELSKSVYKLF